MKKLDRITRSFDIAYQRNKKAQESLKTRQANMFRLFNDTLAAQPLARKTVRAPADLDHDAIDNWIKTYHPGWRSLGSPSHGSSWLILEEDPTLKRFTYINPVTGRVYGRTVVEGSPMLDDERIRTEDPELWERISSWPEPWWSLVRGAIQSQTSLKWSDAALDEAADEYLQDQGVLRVVKDPSTLSDNELSELQPYLHPGPVTVRLVPPRDAKPEELND